MSTPDKATKNAPETPTVGGVNAYKINRSGLVPPTPVAAPTPVVDAPVRQAPPAPTQAPKTKRFVYVLAGLVLLVGLAFALHRGALSPTTSGPGVASVRGDVARPAPLPAYRALVIGINQYAQNGADSWQTLRSARADAEAIAKTLTEDFGFHVQTLLDGEASRSAVLSALDDMATTGADGADLIYFAGHGYFDEKLQEGYWIPSDARKRIDGREAKEDWIWNSSITRLINASHARHVLVMSDACFSGSLFRGDEALSDRTSQSWYERAIAKPSRYLITSGGLEPVQDSSAGHSVFAQQIINYLVHGDRAVFSANDLGLALREKVAALTGQMVQMGPLPVSGHAGGEFVFLRQRAGKQLATLSPQAVAVAANTRGPEPAEDAKARQDMLRDAVEMARAGAPKAASGLVASLLQQDAQDPLARAVADYIARTQGQEGRAELRALIDAVAAKAKAVGDEPDGKSTGARPRVLACLGPVPAMAGAPVAEGAALLYRIALRSELEARSGFKVIEREELATLLQEQNLGVSDLADPRARLAIGKLLPASVLLLGDLIPTAQGETLYLRLVDTETTQVIASFNAIRAGDEAPEKVCADLATRITERMTVLKPLLAPVTGVNGARLRAGLGAYHGAREGMAFSVLTRTLRDRKVPDDFAEQEVGTATVANATEYTCELDAVWGAGGEPRAQDLWVRERPAVPAAQP